MDMKHSERAPEIRPEQLRYARVLEVGMKVGLLLLVIGFLTYVFGIVPPHVPPDTLPSLWTLSASEYLRATGMPHGWGWTGLLHRGDVLPFVGIVVLCGISLVCFAAIIPLLVARRDWTYVGIAVLEICVLVLAASSTLTAAH